MSLNGEALNVFVSTPFGNKTFEQIQDVFSKTRRAVAKKYPNRWIRVIPTYILGEPEEPTNCDALWYLGKSLEKMSSADLVVFTPSWSNTRGCIVEHECAERYNFPILELKDEDYT